VAWVFSLYFNSFQVSPVASHFSDFSFFLLDSSRALLQVFHFFSSIFFFSAAARSFGKWIGHGAGREQRSREGYRCSETTVRTGGPQQWIDDGGATTRRLRERESSDGGRS
jgi:hypothetical protein